MNPMLAGALLGVGGTVVLAFMLLAAIDNRYVGRREYEATLQDIQRQLTTLTKFMPHISGED